MLSPLLRRVGALLALSQAGCSAASLDDATDESLGASNGIEKIEAQVNSKCVDQATTANRADYDVWSNDIRELMTEKDRSKMLACIRNHYLLVASGSSFVYPHAGTMLKKYLANHRSDGFGSGFAFVNSRPIRVNLQREKRFET